MKNRKSHFFAHKRPLSSQKSVIFSIFKQTLAIVNGADVVSVSEKLGHADKSTMLRMYTYADAESVKKAGDIFRSALKAAENDK